MSGGRSIILLALACAAAASANFALLSRDEYRKTGGGAATLLDPSAAASSIRIARRGCPEIIMEKSQAWRLVEPYAGSVDDPTVISTIHFIRKMGNVAAHDGGLNKEEAVKTLEELHFLTGEFCILLGLAWLAAQQG